MTDRTRIIWLHRKLLKGEYPSLREMALVFKISIRQAEREIGYFRKIFRAPLKYSRKYGGYYYSEPFEFPLLFNSGIPDRRKSPVASAFERAIANREKLFMRLNDKSGIFIPYYYNASRESLIGRFEDSMQVMEIILGELKLVKIIDKQHYEVPIFNSEKTFPLKVKRAKVRLGSEFITLIYETLQDVIQWLLENKKAKPTMISPKRLIKELLAISRTIEKAVDIHTH
ncbi:hypothetical protein [Kosmotoga pacifica]|uniref:WYL domain-containing protein n=1 Tax=Kosmotoga pacifica TaxID=1330330 RepID=A0A0G2ZBV2_9BACT|nr:hypothetical protein [Kosmotoga pacifica]AKI97551.1 hypothetical protein IX53_06675 [Kosmotoga pacifica]